MPVDDKGGAFPAISPGGCVGRIRALGRAAIGIDHLNAGGHLNGLLHPWLAGKEAAVDEDSVGVTIVFELWQALQVGPVFLVELLDRLQVVVLEQVGPVLSQGGENAQLVVAEDGLNAFLAGDADSTMAVRPPVDQVAQLDHAVTVSRIEQLE